MFGIINNMPIGVTIHEIDCELDHGAIIVQKELYVDSWETSGDLYKRIQQEEVKLLKIWLNKIIKNEYTAVQQGNEGNINYKKDFINLCKIDLNENARLNNRLCKCQ